jgi:hypothetical protein
MDPDDTITDLKIINNSNVNIIWGSSDMYEEDHNPWISNSSGKVTGTMESVKQDNHFYIKARDFHLYPLTEGYKASLEKQPVKYFIYDYDSVRLLPWERIREERIILKEVTFNTWEELEACDFTITYP